MTEGSDARPETASQQGPQRLSGGAATIEYRHELVRKAIHLTSLSIPIVYYFISRESALLILLPLTAAFIIVDTARYYFEPVSVMFYRTFGWLLRRHEQDVNKKRLNGATNVLISATLCVLLFPKIITVNAFAVLIISDSTSALVGRRFGKHRLFRKSAEGTAAFFVSAVLVILAAPKVHYVPLEYVIGAVAAAVGAVVEAASVWIDDNLSIPISIGLVMWGLYATMLPAVDLSLIH